MINRILHTTRHYRGRGEDLLIGVFTNVLAALFIAVFHFLHRQLEVLPRHYFQQHADVCIPTGILLAFLLVSIFSIKKHPEAMNPLPRSGDDYRQGPAPQTSLGIWFSYGLIFNLQMISIAVFLAWYAGNYFFLYQPWLNFLQTTLAFSFWISAFTYLPVLGLARSGGFKKYWARHRHLFIFPGAVAVHTAGFYQLLKLGLAQLFPEAPAGADQNAKLLLIILSGFIGFFTTLPIYTLYERLLFGRNISTDPEKIRAHYMNKS